MLVLLLILGEVVMRIWSRRKTYRRPVDLMGHTGYATDEGVLIPWPVLLFFMEGIQETRDHLHLLTEEMKKWHNQIPDGEERMESMRRMHEDAAQPIEQIASVHGAVARAGLAPGVRACRSGGADEKGTRQHERVRHRRRSMSRHSAQ
jgi:hypothetical protein